MEREICNTFTLAPLYKLDMMLKCVENCIWDIRGIYDKTDFFTRQARQIGSKNG